MTRTTVDLDPSVLRDLKARGRQEGKSLGQIASELLARALAAQDETPEVAFEWTAQPMVARIDLDDKEAVQGALDGR